MTTSIILLATLLAGLANAEPALAASAAPTVPDKQAPDKPEKTRAPSDADTLAVQTSAYLALVSSELKGHKSNVNRESDKRMAVTRELDLRMRRATLEVDRELVIWRNTGQAAQADAVASIRLLSQQAADVESRVQAEQQSSDATSLTQYRALALPARELDAVAKSAAKLGKTATRKEHGKEVLGYLKDIRAAYRKSNDDAGKDKKTAAADPIDPTKLAPAP